jgi:hypothetical protein
MSALELLSLIVAALLLQVSLGTVVVFRRRRQASGPPSLPLPQGLQKPSSGAWSGLREFRVTGRVYEDASQSQCSLHLAPVDDVPLPAFLPGQFLAFSLPAGSGPQATTIIRCYSLSDLPDPSA